MKKIPLTQGKFALVDDDDYNFLMKWKWYAYNNGAKTSYAARHIRKADGGGTVSMHRTILEVTDRNVLVDHIDHDGLNNQRLNLRKCNKSQNAMNMAKATGTSKYKGVSFNARLRKWESHIKLNGKKKHLGFFDKEVSAAFAYNLAAMKHFSEFANLNNV